MAFQAGSNHYIGFYVGSTGLITSSFTVNAFTVNGSAVSSATLASLKITEVGGGYYYATYVPSVSGTYFLGLSNGSFHLADCEDMMALNIVNLSQDTGGTNALQPSLPTVNGAVGTTLSQYLLMVFQSSDWNVGRTDTSYAVGITQLDDSGNWLSTPIAVSPGQSYTVLIRNNAGLTMVIQPNLEV